MISVMFKVDKQDVLASASAYYSKSPTVFFSILGLMTFCVSCDRAPAEKEIGTHGMVTMTSATPSEFADQYRQAADLIERNNIGQAARIYTNLMEKEPTAPEPYVGLGSCEMERGNPTIARQLYEKAFQIDPKCAAALVGIGSSYDRVRNFTNALRFFQKAIDVDPTCAQGHYGLTRVYSEIGDKTNAREHFEQFKKLFPQSRYLRQMEYYIDHSWPGGTNSLKTSPSN